MGNRQIRDNKKISIGSLNLDTQENRRKIFSKFIRAWHKKTRATRPGFDNNSIKAIRKSIAYVESFPSQKQNPEAIRRLALALR